MDEYALEFDQYSLSSKTSFKANQSEFGTATNVTVTPRTRTVSDRKSARSLSKRVYTSVPYIPYVQKLQALISDVNYSKLSVKQISDESSQLTDKLKALNKELSKYVDKKQAVFVKNVKIGNQNKLETQSVMSNISRQSSRSLNPKYFNIDTEINNTEKIIIKLRADNHRLQQRELLISEPKYLNDLKNQISAAQKVITNLKTNITKLQNQRKDIEKQLQDLNNRNGIPSEVKKIHGIKLEISIFETKIVESNNRLEKISEDLSINQNVMKEKNKIYEELCQKAKQLNIPIHQQKQKEMHEQDKRMHLKKLREKLQINEKNIDQMEKSLRMREEEMKKEIIEVKRRIKDIEDDIWLKDRDLGIQNKEISNLMEEAGIEKLQQVNNYNLDGDSNTSRINTQQKELEEDIDNEEKNIDVKNTTFHIIKKDSSSQQSKRNDGLNPPKSQSKQRAQESDNKPKFQHLMDYKRKDSSKTLDNQNQSMNNYSKHLESQDINENDTSFTSKPKFIIKKMKKADDEQGKENVGYLKLQQDQNNNHKNGNERDNHPQNQQQIANLSSHQKNESSQNQQNAISQNNKNGGVMLKKDGDDNSDLSDSNMNIHIANKLNRQRTTNEEDSNSVNSKPTFNFRSRSNNSKNTSHNEPKQEESMFKEIKAVPQQQNGGVAINNMQPNQPYNPSFQSNGNNNSSYQATFQAQKQETAIFPKIEEKNGVGTKVEETKTVKQEEDLYSFVPRRVQRNRGGGSYNNDSYMPSLLQHNDQNKPVNHDTNDQSTSLPRVNKLNNQDHLFDEKQKESSDTKNTNQNSKNNDQSDILHYKPGVSRARGGTPFNYGQENTTNNVMKPSETANFYNPSFGNASSNNNNANSGSQNQNNGAISQRGNSVSNSNDESYSQQSQQPKLFNFGARRQQQINQGGETNHVANSENNNNNNTNLQQKPNQQNINNINSTNNNSFNAAPAQPVPVETKKEEKKVVPKEEYTFLGPNDRQRRQPLKVQKDNVAQKRNIFDENNSSQSNNQQAFEVKDLSNQQQQQSPIKAQQNSNVVHSHQNVNFFDDKKEGNDSDGLDFLRQESKPKVNYDDDDDFAFSKNKKEDTKFGLAKKAQIGQKPVVDRDQRTKELAQKAKNADLFGELDI